MHAERRDEAEEGGPSSDGAGEPRRIRRALGVLRNIDGHPLVLGMARVVRSRLPGDVDYGDPLSTAGSDPPHLIGQRLATITADRPSAVRELGMSALQVWQAVSEASGRGHGHDELAILFTDLAGFSDWTLEAGDTLAVELLRRVGKAGEPCVERHGGRVVKRLGDGLMAVFPDAAAAVDAALAMQRAVATVQVGGHRPRLRAGVHVGRPRKLGSDYFGADVNIAARIAVAAAPEQVLISEAVRERLADAEGVTTRRRWVFISKGTPRGLRVYAATSPGAG